MFIGHEKLTCKLEFSTFRGISEKLSGDFNFDYENHTYLLIVIN